MAYKRTIKTMKKEQFFLFWLMLICFSFLSCSKDDEEATIPTLDKTSVTLFVDETSQITYSGSDKCIWSSENELIAEVKNGVVTAQHVGTTIIHANGLSCNVTVKPKYTSFTEPYIEWDSNMATIKKHMSGYTLKKEDSDNLGYLGKGQVDAYLYTFENGRLKTCGFSTSLLYSLELTRFLLERYCVVKYDNKSSDDIICYLESVDLKYYVMLYANKSGCAVIYTKAESTKSSDNVKLNSKLKETYKTVTTMRTLEKPMSRYELLP